MNENNKKRHLKEFWEDYGRAIKVGGWCLLIGFSYGLAKGVQAQGKLMGAALSELIDKVPTLPAPDDIPLDVVLQGCSKKEILELMELIGCED